MERPRMIDLFLEGQLAETAVLLAVLVVAVLAVRLLLRLPAEVKPAPAAATLAPVPPAIPIPPAECAFRPGVTEEEREELMLFAQAHASGLAPHGGLLALGAAREILAIAPSARERERARLLLHYGKTLEWRKLTAADEVLWRGVPPALLAGAQSESWEYGQTSGGLPVFVDRAVSWLGAISAARRQGVTPEQYGAQRLYWHERCLEVTRRRHAAGAGNGQYIHVIDFAGIDVGISEIPGYWPYLRQAAVAVALNYGGVCARIYVARPPRAFSWGWRLLRPFLTEATNAKVAIVSPRSGAPHIAHYDFSPLTAMTPESLPCFLGGTVQAPLGPMHFCCQDDRPKHVRDKMPEKGRSILHVIFACMK